MIPALDAVKIRCLSGRTSSSTRRHSMACQSKGCVLRSCHHAHCARGVNLSSGSGASIIFLSTGSPDRVKSSFASGHQARYPDGFPTRPPGGGGQHVPVSRRLSAACIRFSVILARRGGLAAERRQEQSNGDAQARSGGHATRVLGIRSLTPTTPVGNFTLTLNPARLDPVGGAAHRGQGGRPPAASMGRHATRCSARSLPCCALSGRVVDTRIWC